MVSQVSIIRVLKYDRHWNLSQIPIIQRISEVCAFTSLGKNFRWSIRWNSGYESFLLVWSLKLRSYSGSPSRKDLLEYMYDRPLLFKERLWQSKLSDRPRPLPNLQARFRDELWNLENKHNHSFKTKNFVVHRNHPIFLCTSKN